MRRLVRRREAEKRVGVGSVDGYFSEGECVETEDPEKGKHAGTADLERRGRLLREAVARKDLGKPLLQGGEPFLASRGFIGRDGHRGKVGRTPRQRFPVRRARGEQELFAEGSGAVSGRKGGDEHEEKGKDGRQDPGGIAAEPPGARQGAHPPRKEEKKEQRQAEESQGGQRKGKKRKKARQDRPHAGGGHGGVGIRKAGHPTESEEKQKKKKRREEKSPHGTFFSESHGKHGIPPFFSVCPGGKKNTRRRQG